MLTTVKEGFNDSIIPIRMLQLALIFLIMRYPCYFSLPLIGWVLLSSFPFFDSQVKVFSLSYFVLPCIIVIYCNTLYASITPNPSLDAKFAFVYQEYFWLECIILHSVIIIIFAYLFILRLLRKSPTEED